ncbi:unnamed protein product [Didymodactylos carnosus]|uniref:Uncharacterized protein n=1 Tax=Didymodactylos carnosus TaxID=1234261 RepID=A0A8S2UI68_9BILA|nr:unnamed protein product [Didymodactylos carnosus]CAF4345061.1 unnamed protein product [Didymodactylos carnosus]
MLHPMICPSVAATWDSGTLFNDKNSSKQIVSGVVDINHSLEPLLNESVQVADDILVWQSLLPKRSYEQTSRQILSTCKNDTNCDSCKTILPCNLISSYTLKIILFNMRKRINGQITPRMLFNELYTCVRRKYLSYYFIPQINVLANVIDNKSTYNELMFITLMLNILFKYGRINRQMDTSN